MNLTLKFAHQSYHKSFHLMMMYYHTKLVAIGIVVKEISSGHTDRWLVGALNPVSHKGFVTT